MTGSGKKIVNDVQMQVKLPKELRDAANKKAFENSQSLSEVIRKFLREYIK